MLSDKDALLRRTAVEYLMSARYGGAHDWIKSRIDMQEFADLEFSEKKHLYIAYATMGGTRTAEWLLERLNQRNLFAKSSIDHERAAAALALARLHVKEARAPIERILGAKLTRSLVKEACAEAIKILDAPPPPSAARPRAPDAPAVRPVRREPPAEPKATVKGHAPELEGAMPIITFRSSPAPAPARSPDLPPDEPMEILRTSHTGEDTQKRPGTLPMGAQPTVAMPAPEAKAAPAGAASAPTLSSAPPPVASAQREQTAATDAASALMRFDLPPMGTLPLDLPPLVGAHFGAPPPASPLPSTPSRSATRRGLAAPSNAPSNAPGARADSSVDTMLRSYVDDAGAEGDD